MIERVLFDSKSIELVSAPFAVYPGGTVILRAWNIAQYKQPANDKEPTNLPQEVKIQMVSFGDIEMVVDEDSACACEAKYEQTTSIKYAEDIVTCCPWSMTACENIATLTLPGVYRLRLNDTSALGEVFVKMMRGPTHLMGVRQETNYE